MGMNDGWSQAKMREAMEYTDQHGRIWFGFGDIKAKLHPATPLTPMGWEAPWYPNQAFARFGPKNPNTFTWDYDGMLAAGLEAEQRYRDLLFAAATHFNVPNFDPASDEPTAQMKRDVGEPPLPLDPIRAAKQGNGYILGLRPFDERRPGDVKLKAALERYQVNTHRVELDDEFADGEEFADETPEPAKRRGRPTNAERAARLAAQEV